jgi:hypothetical protein
MESHRRLGHRRWGPWLLLGVLLVASFPGVLASPPTHSERPADAPGADRPNDLPPPPPGNNISYASSLDAWPLSYLEWLPASYSAAASYPLAVFFHGIHSSNGFIRGGAGGLTDISDALTQNASSNGFILISLNTRTLDGFYINSPCGGSQEQDALDAIAHESALRHVSAVYLIGFSMGSAGVLFLAGHHPGMFAGIATAGTISDIYETTAYNIATGAESLGLFNDECGDGPSPANRSIDAVWTSLSVLRFAPQNFSGTALFVTGGGDDLRAPNNFDRWNFANVNNTFVNSTCNVVTSMGEPAGCTVTIPTLSVQDPPAYRWLDLYEPYAPHSAQQLPGAAVFSFFLGQQAGGYFVSTYPGDVLTPYTPGTPIPIAPPPAFHVELALFTEVAFVAVVLVAVVVVVLAVRRRAR